GVAGGVERALVRRMRWARGDADADCDRADLFDRCSRDRLPQTLRRGTRARFVRAREQQRELFAAEPRGRVVVARERGERGGDVAYGHVARGVAVRVVDALHVVNVHEQQGAGSFITSPAFQFVAERGAEAAAIGETRAV